MCVHARAERAAGVGNRWTWQLEEPRSRPSRAGQQATGLLRGEPRALGRSGRRQHAHCGKDTNGTSEQSGGEAGLGQSLDEEQSFCPAKKERAREQHRDE